MSGKKKKTEITFIEFCNGHPSKKMQIMVIGTALNPNKFHKKSGQQLGFDYHAKKKAWMNKPLFYDWVIRLDNYIGKNRGGRFY